MEKIQIDQNTARPFPLGTQVENDKIHLSFVCEKEGEVQLHLYPKASAGEEILLPFPEENRMGKIRYMTITGINAADYEYSLSAAGEPVENHYADLVFSGRAWGEKPLQEEEAEEEEAKLPTRAVKIMGQEKHGKKMLPVRYGFLDETFAWGADIRPGYSLDETILYRLHVRGFSMDPGSGVRKKGTFAGIAEKIPYLKSLGVTMLELQLPDEFDEVLPGAVNYWGYGPAYCRAPKAAYAGSERADLAFKKMVKACHEAGLEVSVELYFEPQEDSAFVLDCLRHWVWEYHVDGIHVSGFYNADAIAEDPALTGTKLFAENWGTVSDKVRGQNHLALWSDSFQNEMRRFLKGDEDCLGLLAGALRGNKRELSCVQYMAGTNGFTMMDMVSYDRKHNEANGENGTDGTDYNYSWNCGAEGPVKKKKVLKLRRQQLRNAWVLLMLGQGIPMILAGDECGNSQEGNNNPWCQDNETGWVSWKRGKMNEDIRSFASYMIRFRREHPLLYPAEGFLGMNGNRSGYPDFSLHGEAPWFPQYEAFRRQLAVMYSCEPNRQYYVMFNMHWEAHTFALPKTEGRWTMLVNTAADQSNGIVEEAAKEAMIELEPRSIVIMRSEIEHDGKNDIRKNSDGK